jgi:hypothetical protein
MQNDSPLEKYQACLWAGDMFFDINAPRKGCPMGREFPTNEEFGPGGVTYG